MICECMRAPLCAAKRSACFCARSNLRCNMERALLRAPCSSANWSVHLSPTPPHHYPAHHEQVERWCRPTRLAGTYHTLRLSQHTMWMCVQSPESLDESSSDLLSAQTTRTEVRSPFTSLTTRCPLYKLQNFNNTRIHDARIHATRRRQVAMYVTHHKHTNT
jgi:hypothetical protein